MSQAVIYDLEFVEIKQEYCRHRSRTLGPDGCQVESLEKQLAVGKSGKFVVRRLVLQAFYIFKLLLALLVVTFGYVQHDAYHRRAAIDRHGRSVDFQVHEGTIRFSPAHLVNGSTRFAAQAFAYLFLCNFEIFFVDQVKQVN
ncbi:hypothetical protein D3C85_1022840 [compost metagenome]